MKPTLDQIWNEELGDPVHSESDTSYRHGEYRTEVYKQSDGTFWQIFYTVSGDGEHNQLRDERDFLDEPVQVYPHIITTTVYSTREQKSN